MSDRVALHTLLAAVLATACWIAAAAGLPVSWRFVIASVALAAAWRAIALREGGFHPAALYIAVSSVYVLAAPLEVAYLGNRLDLDPQRMMQLGDLGVLFLVCSGGAYLLTTRRSDTVTTDRPLTARTAQAAIVYCAALFVLCLALALQRYGLGIGQLSRAEIYADEYVLLSLLRGQLALGLGVTAALVRAAETAAGRPAPQLRGVLWLVLAAYAVLDLAILGDRRLPLAAALSVAALLLPRHVSWRTLAGFGAAIVLLTLYGFVRNTPPSQWIATLSSGDLLGALSPAAQEFGGIAVIGGSLESLSATLPGFPGYDQALLQIIPRALIADRPLSPTEWFVTTYFPALAEIGASFAFNAVIEALLNGGLPMVILAGACTGMLLAGVAGLGWRGAPYGIALAVFVFTFSMRMDLASLLRTGLIAGVGLATQVAAVAMILWLRPPDRPIRGVPA